MMLADVAIHDGDIAQALDYAERAVAAAPEDYKSQLFLGSMHMRLQRFIEAIEPLERALAQDPEALGVMQLLVEAYTATGRLNQAESMLKRLERATVGLSGEKKQDTSLLWARLMLAKGENLDEVEFSFRLFFEENREDLRALNDLMTVLVQQDRKSEAEELAKEFAVAQGTRPEAWLRLGQFYLGDLYTSTVPEASSALTRALLAKRNYPPALRSLIAFHLGADNRATALGLCRRYLEYRPDDPAVLYQMALLLAQHKDSRKEALSKVNRAIAIVERSEFHYLRASLFISMEKYEEALQDLHRVARNKEINSANLDLALAEAYMGTQQRDLAQQYYDFARNGFFSEDGVASDRLKRVGELLDKEDAANDG